MEANRRICDLYLYPIESCRGSRVPEAVLGPYGLQYDRQWMVTRHDGTFLTQRELPALVCVVPQMDATGLTLSWGFDEAPVLVHKRLWETGASFQLTMQKESIHTIDQGDEVAAWLSRFLKQTVRLVYLPDEALRITRMTTQGVQNDVLLASRESLSELNRRIQRPIGITRFRPNIVTAGSPEPFEEDGWGDFSARSPYTHILFRNVRPCICDVTITMHPGTGERQDQEPLQALSNIHKDGPHALFGMHVTALNEGTLHIGDTIDVKTFGPRP